MKILLVLKNVAKAVFFVAQIPIVQKILKPKVETSAQKRIKESIKRINKLKGVTNVKP